MEIYASINLETFPLGKQTCLLSGGAGFISQTLIRRLLEAGLRVVAVDNLVRGCREFVAEFESRSDFEFREIDCSLISDVRRTLEECGKAAGAVHIWHLAANSDIPAGIEDPTIDLRDTFLTTFELLRAAREFDVASFNFASSSAIYGDLGDVPAREDSGPLEPISNYGAMKLASEAQIRAAVEAFLPRANIFRFPNVIGVPATHGVIVDLVRKLKATPARLDVLGDGSQRKPYLHVDDLVDAMLFIAREARGRHNVLNIGPHDVGVSVRYIAEAVRDRVSPSAEIHFGEGDRGWVGDVPRFSYDTGRLTEMGWTPRLNSEQAVLRAVDEIARQEGFV